MPESVDKKPEGSSANPPQLAVVAGLLNAEDFPPGEGYVRPLPAETILRQLPVGVVVIDTAGRVERFNPVAKQIFPLLTVGNDWPQIVAAASPQASTSGDYVRLANGRAINVATRSLQGNHGQLVLLTDSTRSRELDLVMRRNTRAEGQVQLAAVVAHQLRTPLATAILQVRNLLTRASAGHDIGDSSTQLMAQLRGMESLVEDMLLFARSGGFNATPITVDELNELVRERLRDFDRPEGFRIAFHAEQSIAPVRANADALVSAMLNIVGNAVEHCDADGRIDIDCRLTPDASQVTWRFEDNGPGISRNVANDIFTPMFSTRQRGNGLGLAIVDAVLRAHRGGIRLETTAPRGARFLMSLPIARVQTMPANQSIASSGGGA